MCSEETEIICCIFKKKKMMQNFWIPYSTRYVFWKFTNLLHILLRDMRLLLKVFLLRTAGLRPPIGEGGREPVGEDAYVLGFLPNKRLYTLLARFIFDPFFYKTRAFLKPMLRWFAQSYQLFVYFGVEFTNHYLTALYDDFTLLMTKLNSTGCAIWIWG